MLLAKLYSEIQVNPRNVAVYRKLADQYRQLGKTNEAEAFEELIRRKFHADNSSTDKEQRINDLKDT